MLATISQVTSQEVNRRTDGAIRELKWDETGEAFTYINKDVEYNYDVNEDKVKRLKEVEPQAKPDYSRYYNRKPIIVKGREIKRPARGHQYRVEVSPDSAWFAVCTESFNLVLESTDGEKKINVTEGGSRKFRYGSANWTYGEEIGVKHGMWWTPDSKKVIYYVFSEEHVKDFYLTFNNTETYTEVWSEGYIKAGEINPIVYLEIYDLETGKRTPVHVGEETRPDQYIYNMKFAPGGEFLFSRTDRLQRDLDVMTVDLETGKTRVVISEKQDHFQENMPTMHFLKDNKRFIWETEKTKWRHYELRNIDGSLITTLTKGDFPVSSIVEVDETNNYLYFTATSDQTKGNHLNTHLHRVKLDGKKQEKLTDQELNHTSFEFSPNYKYFITKYESVNVPPSTALYTADGKLVKILAQGPEGSNRSEFFTFMAEDGVTVLYGILNKPADFDENKTYPLILTLYGGPDGTDVRNKYKEGSDTYNKKGYLTCNFSYRGGSGRGKAFLDIGYGRLGDIDIQDQSDGCRFLAKRSYIDEKKIGITGHSYGGFMAAMGAVKHSDIFAAAVDRAGPTHWKHYDDIYTERFMNTPQNNPEGYEKGSVFPYIKDMDCKILIQHGLQDDNVHPTNAWHFVDELNKAGKFYELQIFPYGTHGFGGRDRVMEFFDRHLKGE
jgi:dipeptidyl-peptidase-4